MGEVCEVCGMSVRRDGHRENGKNVHLRCLKDFKECLWCSNPENLEQWAVKLGTMPYGGACYVRGVVKVGNIIDIIKDSHGYEAIRVRVNEVSDFGRHIKVEPEYGEITEIKQSSEARGRT